MTAALRASLGTFGARTGAWLVDAIPYIVVPYLAARIGGWPFAVAAYPIVGILWSILPEGRTGATPGKRLIGLRTLDIDQGTPIGSGRSAVRWLVKYVGCSVLPVGYLWYFRTPAHQTLADLAVRSVVVTPLAGVSAGDGPSG